MARQLGPFVTVTSLPVQVMFWHFLAIAAKEHNNQSVLRKKDASKKLIINWID
jgi:hypothetical protein